MPIISIEVTESEELDLKELCEELKISRDVLLSECIRSVLRERRVPQPSHAYDQFVIDKYLKEELHALLFADFKLDDLE